ncbi:hypothetical protein L1887_23060 [Cichorium endivia]|nr:hypothetical protein L1887_23060 [Cichorium endivia]
MQQISRVLFSFWGSILVGLYCTEVLLSCPLSCVHWGGGGLGLLGVGVSSFSWRSGGVVMIFNDLMDGVPSSGDDI